MPPLPERRKDRERSGQVPKGRLGAEFGLQRSPRSDDLDPTHTSVWVPANVCGEPPPPERLALGGRDRVSEHRPGRLGLRWPVFSCPSMAGFGVSTEGSGRLRRGARTASLGETRCPRPSCPLADAGGWSEFRSDLGLQTFLWSGPRFTSRPTPDCSRDSGGWRFSPRGQEGARASVQPTPPGRTRPGIAASFTLSSTRAASLTENPCTELRAWRTSRSRALELVRDQGGATEVESLWQLSTTGMTTSMTC